MKITWIGQSGYILKTDKTEIIIDPYLSDVVNKIANRPRLIVTPINPKEIKADAVICTHNHLDHLDIDAVPLMPKGTHFITTNEGKEKLVSLGQNNVTVLNIGESISVGDFEITAVFAKHTIEAFGVIVKCEGKTYYFSGDTLFDEKLFGIAEYKPDFAFICINGKLGNMNVEEAVITAKKIGAKVNIPNHYGMFASNTEDPHKFTDNIGVGFIMDYNKEYRMCEDINNIKKRVVTKMHNKRGFLINAISLITIILLAILLALSYQLFVVENNFAPAGLNGISTMIQYKTGFSIGYMSLIINVPLCIFAFFFVGKKFSIYTLIFSSVYSFSFLYFQKMGLEQFQYRANGHNTIFPVILSGVISGFIYGVCFGKNASTGGTDIISKYISTRNLNINFFWVTFIINVIVAIVSFFVYAKPSTDGILIYDYSPVCLCILYCFISSFMGDYIIRETKTAVKFTIITEYPEEISKEITTKLKHSSTKIDAVGTYLYKSRAMIICVVNKHQIVDLSEILGNYDNTFSFSETVNETYGNFKHIR